MTRTDSPTTFPSQVEVAVVGGGPAGAATAIALARSGRQVVVLERSGCDEQRVAETLPPAVKPLLRELGVWEQFRSDDHVPSPGIVSIWGSDVPYENDFIVSPYGHGWHVDRRRFDGMLVAAAGAAGAEVFRRVHLHSCRQQSSGEWSLEVSSDTHRSRMTAGFLVEATGRDTPPTAHPSIREVLDQLIGIIGFLPSDSSDAAEDRRTLVEAAENGWWYSALLPDGHHLVAYMTDADLVPHRWLWETWQQALSQAPHTRKRIAPFAQDRPLRIVAANSYRRAGIAGWNRLAVGDAAVAFDPLSSLGLQKALASALLAADAIDGALRGADAVLEGYALWIEQQFADYLKARSAYYARERRWPHSPFWSRRHSFGRKPVPIEPTLAEEDPLGGSASSDGGHL